MSENQGTCTWHDNQNPLIVSLDLLDNGLLGLLYSFCNY